MFGCGMPLSAKKQKTIVTELLDDTLSGKFGAETVNEIYGEIGRRAMSEEEYNKNLDKEDLKNILRDSGVGDDAVKEFDKGFDDRIENNKKIPAENLINKKAVIIKTGSVEIKAEPDIADKFSLMGTDYQNMIAGYISGGELK